MDSKIFDFLRENYPEVLEPQINPQKDKPNPKNFIRNKTTWAFWTNPRINLHLTFACLLDDCDDEALSVYFSRHISSSILWSQNSGMVFL